MSNKDSWENIPLNCHFLIRKKVQNNETGISIVDSNANEVIFSLTYDSENFEYTLIENHPDKNVYLICSGNKIYNLTQKKIIEVPTINFKGAFDASPNGRFFVDYDGRFAPHNIIIYDLTDVNNCSQCLKEEEYGTYGWDKNNCFEFTYMDEVKLGTNKLYSEMTESEQEVFDDLPEYLKVDREIRLKYNPETKQKIYIYINDSWQDRHGKFKTKEILNNLS